jgi:dihydrofolate reductase
VRKLILYMFTTLDGFIAGPNGEFDDYEPSDEEMVFANEVFGAAEGILFGRVCYDGFVEYWDSLDVDDPETKPLEAEFARLFRQKTRVVFSRTRDQAEGNDILIKDNLPERVMQLKQQPGGDLLLVCGPELLAALVQHGLVDECRLLIKPSVLGQGMALFGALPAKQQLKLLSTRSFASGAVTHHYRLVGSGNSTVS